MIFRHQLGNVGGQDRMPCNWQVKVEVVFFIGEREREENERLTDQKTPTRSGFLGLQLQSVSNKRRVFCCILAFLLNSLDKSKEDRHVVSGAKKKKREKTVREWEIYKETDRDRGLSDKDLRLQPYSPLAIFLSDFSVSIYFWGQSSDRRR